MTFGPHFWFELIILYYFLWRFKKFYSNSHCSLIQLLFLYDLFKDKSNFWWCLFQIFQHFVNASKLNRYSESLMFVLGSMLDQTTISIVPSCSGSDPHSKLWHPGLKKWKLLKITKIIRNDVKCLQNIKTSLKTWFWMTFNLWIERKTKKSKIGQENDKIQRKQRRKQCAFAV